MPTARCSLSGASVSGHNRAYLFGGVYDEELEDDLTSTFYNDLFMLDMQQSTPTWRSSKMINTLKLNKQIINNYYLIWYS